MERKLQSKTIGETFYTGTEDATYNTRRIVECLIHNNTIKVKRNKYNILYTQKIKLILVLSVRNGRNFKYFIIRYGLINKYLKIIVSLTYFIVVTHIKNKP